MDWMSELGWQEPQIDDLRYLGYSYVKEGIYPTALAFFEALTVLSPNNAYDLQTLGALHLQTGNGMRALDYLDRALKLEPASTEVLLNRAKALFMLGYRRQGIAQAMELANCDDPKVASEAGALLLAYK
jgi:tetratricopeptide (TPR) repeat protein